MTYEIFQAYYKQDQIDKLDPNFTPYDNTANPHPELREHYINKKVYEIAIDKGLDFWGTFSWRYHEKFSWLESEKCLAYVDKAQSLGLDVILFDWQPENIVFTYNVWEFGEWCHPGMIEICEELFPLIGLDKNLLYYPMGETVYSMACFFAGNKKFWDKWLWFIDRYLEKVKELPPQLFAKHESPSNYGDSGLGFFPFIHERLFSTFLLAYHKDFRSAAIGHPWHSREHSNWEIMNTNKMNGILYKDYESMNKWYQLRSANIDRVSTFSPIIENVKKYDLAKIAMEKFFDKDYKIVDPT